MLAAFWKRRGNLMRASMPRRVAGAMLQPVVEPILHPSEWRIRALGLSTAIGHPLFYWVWTYWLPQPYESLWQRGLMSFLGLVLLVAPQFKAHPPGRRAAFAFSTIFWITLPVYFTWMYFCNGANAVWLATMAAMFLIYYHLTDWRIATVGIATGLPFGWLLAEAFGTGLPLPPPEELSMHVVVFCFAWYMALMLGISSSNLRREQLKQALGTMGIMAHELRTPLATMALIGDAMRSEAHALPAAHASVIEKLASRLHLLVRNMNRQIDTQMTNAQLMHLPTGGDHLSAAALARTAVANFPFRSERERECVQVHVHADFTFKGAESLFLQVIDNLMKNALRSLAAKPTPTSPGDLVISVDVAGRRGLICLTDRGQGIEPEMQARLFQLFASTHSGTGHGLGLAFCHRVVHAAGGTIRIDPGYSRGARFKIELPLAAPEPIATRTLERSHP
ncbi:HAMP domain-containing histidine kinase [Ramlibacter sp. AW1]|uniref:histidine kinase n=1 Tax=Ramlibacter aurantiacus TaxID=2801330 RepID=A0A936ZW92_9BURK|nr:HAMP domain-containing sensor histidine kinase [Ramlibacter aurantiacus]MBL0422280.1 HAMP domain-containing histidine kinase [Ramlibacter aurantiacus]